MANIARDTQVIRESVQTGNPQARVVQVFRESIILPTASPNEDYWRNPVAPVPSRLFQRLPLGDPEELPAASLALGQPDEDFWRNLVPPIPGSLWQRLPLGDPEELPAGSLVGPIPRQDEDFWQNPAAPVPARLWQRLPLGDPEEIPASSLALGKPDEDYWRNPSAPVPASLYRSPLLGDQEEIPAGSLLKGQPDEDFWRNPTKPVAATLYQQLPYLFDEAIWTSPPIPKSAADKPSIQLHPLRKPLDFYTAPPTQPGKRSASFTTLLTQAGAQRAFSMPLGARNQPLAGKVFSFTMGGMIIPGTVGGQMTITPLYGATADGVNLGHSVSQAYPASTAPIPWRLKGEIIFQAVDLTHGASLVVCTGSFAMGDVAIMFGSANPIQVDASSVSPSASGALNFAVTFAPSVLNVKPPVISTKYAFLR